MEAAPVMNWALKDMTYTGAGRMIRGDSGQRAQNYWNWLEMIAAHSSG